MNYYKLKRRALVFVDENYKKGANLNQICLKVGSLFGFSPNFVMKRIALIDKCEAQRNETREEDQYKGEESKPGIPHN